MFSTVLGVVALAYPLRQIMVIVKGTTIFEVRLVLPKALFAPPEDEALLRGGVNRGPSR